MLKFGIVVFPGSNCDHDCYHTIKHVLGHEARFVWHEETDLSDYDCIIIPGGFSYGDYLRTGSIASLSPIMRSVSDYACAGGPVIGICNGFQVLVEAGLLPGSLIKNASLKFICKWVYLRLENSDTLFTSNMNIGDVLRIPVAHGEGNYFCTDEDLKELERNSQIIFRYSTPSGEVIDEANPNGSLDNIAGISNKEGNVLGMMPHPERCSEGLMGGEDGRAIFESLISNLHQKGRAIREA
jgi:phosphoribosylformylglycinamidine synthase subunit PurQ / glutaminase